MSAQRVTKTHHVDASEQRPNGFYDYYYAYDEYAVDLDGRGYGVRVYDDTPRIGYIHTAPDRRIAHVDRDDLRVLLDLLRPDGVNEIHMLGRSGGYERVEL